MPAKVPRLVAHVDVRKFKLDAMDGFLLTRIDGKLSPKDLARETGLPDFSVDRAIDKLEKLGIVEMIDPRAPPPDALPPPPPPHERAKPALPEFHSLQQKYDPQELDEQVDLSDDVKKRILDFYYRLDDLDHYTLLGVQQDADKKAVKRAYFEYAGLLHPDRYFKKQLGTFKLKMEVLFTRVTEAHDTLVDAAKRLDYDAYLDEVETTRGMEALLEKALAESAKVTTTFTQVTTREPSAKPPEPPSQPELTGPTPEEIQARKEVLARRLLGGSGASVRAKMESRPPLERPDPRRYANPQDAMDALKRRYEDRIESATVAQSRKYILAGEEALAKKDVVAAASAFSIAAKFAPDDAALAMRYHEVKNEADKLLSASYAKQAVYEEKEGHWPEAAKNWQKIAKIEILDARAQERAANALLHCKDADLHQAAEHAKKAIAVEPQNIAYYVTLAEVYVKAGLTASARRALEVAMNLDPKHAGIVALQKRVGKG